MFLFRMLKPVKDAFFLEQTRDEVEAGFTVLDSEFPLGKRGPDFKNEVGEAMLGKDFFYDLDSGHVLEMAAIVFEIEEPEPGNEGRFPVVNRLFLIFLAKKFGLADDAVQDSRWHGLTAQGDDDRLAQQVFIMNCSVFRSHDNAKAVGV